MVVELEQLPVHSVLLAIAGKVIDLRDQDRRLQPDRSWQAILDVFQEAKQVAWNTQDIPRQSLNDPDSAQLSTWETIRQADAHLDLLSWPQDPDVAMAKLARLLVRYCVTVPRELVVAHYQSKGEADTVDLTTETGLRESLKCAWAHAVEDWISLAPLDQDH